MGKFKWKIDISWPRSQNFRSIFYLFLLRKRRGSLGCPPHFLCNFPNLFSIELVNFIDGKWIKLVAIIKIFKFYVTQSIVFLKLTKILRIHSENWEKRSKRRRPLWLKLEIIPIQSPFFWKFSLIQEKLWTIWEKCHIEFEDFYNRYQFNSFPINKVDQFNRKKDSENYRGNGVDTLNFRDVFGAKRVKILIWNFEIVVRRYQSFI